jgi:hypothetical protein
MNTTTPLDIKVVYDASSRRKRKGTVVPGGERKRAAPILLVVGLLNLAAAGGLCYATWWPIDSFIYMNFVLRTPLDIDLDAAAGAIMPGLSADSPQAAGATDLPVGELPPPTIVGRTAQIVIGVTGYSWLTLATMAACALALAGGAAWGRSGGALWRTAGLLLAVVVVAGLAWFGYSVWTEYGTVYPPGALDLGMGGLVLLAALVGMAIGRGARGLTRLAGIMLIISAAGSVAGLYSGRLCGAVESQYASFSFMAVVFVIHSVWGWVLLPLASRMRR